VGLPAELLARLRGVADELLDLGRAQEPRVETDVGLRIEAHVIEATATSSRTECVLPVAIT